MLVKGKLYPHKYDNVIGLELYEKVDLVRKGHKVNPRKWAGLPFAYRGLIRCALCGCSITFERKKGKYVYGHCTKYRGKHDTVNVNEDLITEQLMKVFESIKVPEAAVNDVSRALRAAQEDKKRIREETLSKLDSEIEKYQRRLDKVYEDYLDEKIHEEFYHKKFDEYKKAQKSLMNKRVNVEQVDDEYYGMVLHLLSLAKNAPRLFKEADIDQKRSLINIVLSNLELNGKQLMWELKKPFDIMALCSENGNWLRGLDSNQQPSR